MNTLRIATRKSPLALWQSEHVAARLRTMHPDLDVQLIPMSTRGDEVLDRSLAAIGGKGLFLKELEHAMLRGEADCAVHSLKDVPMDLEPDFSLPAVLQREDPADAFISPHCPRLDALPRNARVGTSSLRRRAQLLAQRPDLQIDDLRGNVNSRLAKLDAGEYDAIILACAGLHRLELDRFIRQRLTPPTWLPAPAQAAVAVESRTDDSETIALLRTLDHPQTRTLVDAERAMNRALHGSCHVPVAALAEYVADSLQLQGLVGNAEDGRLVRAQAVGSPNTPEALGHQVAEHLLRMGAGEFLK